MKNNKLAKNLVIFTLVIIGLLLTVFTLGQISQNTTSHDLYDEPPNIEGQPMKGNESAEITIVEFGDFMCPSCNEWKDRIFPRLKEDYIDTGIANFVYINSLFQGEGSVLSALAAEAVWEQDEEAYWVYHDELYNTLLHNNRQSLDITVDTLVDIASEHTPQIDIQKLKEDIQERRHLPQLEHDMDIVEEYNIQLTPSLVINNTLIDDPFDYDEIVSVIEDILKGE